MGISNPEQSQRILHSLSSIYNTVHVFNLEKNTVEEVYAFKEVHDFFENYAGKMDIQSLIHLVVKNTTTNEYLKSILEFTNFSTLQERLENKKSLSFDFIGSIHGWTRSSFVPVSYNEKGDLVEVVYATRIIQEDKEREEKLLALIDFDELTGVYNRRGFEREIEKIEREDFTQNLTIVSFDINGLKVTNDTYGHSAGDELIKGAADCIKNVFGDYGKIFRIGGDEFCAIIDCDLKTLVDLFGVFDTTTAAWEGKKISDLTLSKGCAAHPEFPDLSIRELQTKADRRMYQEKQEFYKTKNQNFSKYIKNPELIQQILKKSNMGIVSLEFEENCAPRLQIDDYIRSFLGFDEKYTPEQVYEEWFRRIHPDYVDSISAGIEKIIIGNHTEVQYPWYHPKAGIAYIRNSGFRDPSYTKGIRINGFFQNITNLIHLQKDTLTGLYAKEFFFQKAEEILANHPDKNYRIFVSDIENFKSINEKYGIETSDRLLEYLAKALKIMAPNLILAGRINADKFVCLQDLTEGQSRSEGLKLQHDILSKAPVQNVIWKHGIYYTQYDRNVSVQTMCDRASFAVESIKGDYEIYCAVYDDNLANRIKTEHQIVENMEDALKNKEFKIYLQPKHDLHTNRTGGAEALVRWIHPEIGFMNPSDFIPVFEKNGFVKNVDQFVLMEVCNLLERWLREGKKVVPISVNLSRRDFEYVDLAEQIIKIVDEHNLPHELIHFELTESAFSDNPERITNMIRKLHNSGFIIELDDFGSGYSSLTSLSEIEFDILKLDMSIIKNDNPNSSRNVLDMCSQIMKQMHFKAVAEGVENEAQFQRLKDIGCDYIQGFFFSKPLPIEEFEEYLAKELE